MANDQANTRMMSTRARRLTLAFLLVASTCANAKLQGEPVQKTPSFQVATIKPSKPEEVLRIQIAGRRFTTTGTTVVDLLKYAYGVHSSQIVGPEWIAKQKFDVLADPETETRPTSDAMKRMVQQLIAERFALSIHRASKELPVFAITLAKSGSMLKETTRDSGSVPSVAFNPSGDLIVANASMADLAAFLQRFVTNLPVVDQTGLPSRYDLSLRWTPDDSPAAANAEAAPGLYTAIQEQLGLKLSATLAPIEVFVIDRVEQPSQN